MFDNFLNFLLIKNCWSKKGKK